MMTRMFEMPPLIPKQWQEASCHAGREVQCPVPPWYAETQHCTRCVHTISDSEILPHQEFVFRDPGSLQ